MLHTTYVYGQQEGKKARLRDNGLWLADPPAYFSGPNFVSMDILPPPVTLPDTPQTHCQSIIVRPAWRGIRLKRQSGLPDRSVRFHITHAGTSKLTSYIK